MTPHFNRLPSSCRFTGCHGRGTHYMNSMNAGYQISTLAKGIYCVVILPGLHVQDPLPELAKVVQRVCHGRSQDWQGFQTHHGRSVSPYRKPSSTPLQAPHATKVCGNTNAPSQIGTNFDLASATSEKRGSTSRRRSGTVAWIIGICRSAENR